MDCGVPLNPVKTAVPSLTKRGLFKSIASLLKASIHCWHSRPAGRNLERKTVREHFVTIGEAGSKLATAGLQGDIGSLWVYIEIASKME